MNFARTRMMNALLSAGVLTLGVAVPFSAQAQTPAPKAEKIEVTGSNIKRVDAESPSIVQVLTKEDIQRSGATTVSELLKTVPAIAGGNLDDFNAGNGFARGTTSASLRGLGSVGTLVLVNGRRISPSATADPNTGQGSAFNLNTIPLSAVERVEILKDGASAIYGSDAIAGVINFILRKDYTGAEVRISGGSTLKNTFRNGTISVAGGFGDLAKDRYNVLFSGEYFTREPEDFNAPNGVLNDDYRRLASRNLNNSSSLSTTPNYFRESVRGNGVFNVALPTDPRCPAANVVSANAGCRANALDYTQIQSKAERVGFLTKGTLEISPTLQATAEVAFTRATNWFVTSAPTLDGTSTGSIWFNRNGQRFQYLLTLPVGHPDNPYTFPVGLRYRFADTGLTVAKVVNDSTRLLAGLSGSHFGWDWESAVLYTEAKREQDSNGQLYYPALVAAVNNGTYRFGGSNSSAITSALNPIKHDEGKTKNTSIDIKASRELFSLPGGMAALALGLESRRESFDIVSDPRTVAGDIVGLASTTVGNSRTVNAFFAELSAPIFKNVETQLAFRYDKYSDFGSATTPKFGIKWKLHPTVSLRGTYSEAFRAPTLTQASSSRVQSFTGGTIDPLRCVNGVALPNVDPLDCTTGRTIASIFNASSGLEPEKSKNWSYGFIWSPANDLDFQADLFEIRRRNQIDRFSAQQVINNEFTPGYTGGTVQRSTNPALFATTAAGVPIPGTGPIETTTRRFLNLGETRVKGVDVEANYKFSLDGGTVRLSALATWTLRYDYQLTKGGAFVNGAGNFYLFETPKLRGNATAIYTKGDWESFWRVNYTGGWDYGDPTATNGCYLGTTSATLAYLGRCQVASWTTHDIGTSYRGFKNLTLAAVVRNIENKKAPYDPNQTTLGFNPTYHNPYGANINLSATYRFK